MDSLDCAFQRMSEAVAAAERRSPREILARQFRAVTMPQERRIATLAASVPVSPWFEEAELERHHQRAAARKAAAKKRAIARKARARQAVTLSRSHPKKRDELEGVLITSVSLST